MKHKGGLPRLVALALLLICLVAVDATTYYVRTDGNDSNTGTANTAGGAWKTFGRIRFGPGPSDVVQIESGTYDEAAVAAYALFLSNATIRGATPNRPVLKNMALELPDTSDGLRLENLIFDANENFENIILGRTGLANLTLVGCDLLHPENVNSADVSHGCLVLESIDGLTLDTCRLIMEPVANSVGYLYNLATLIGFGPSQNWLIKDTEFSLNPLTANGAGGNIALYDGLSNVEIVGCTFTTSTRETIYIYGAATTVPNFTFANWNIHNCGILETRVVTSFYISEPQLLVNWQIKNNLWKNTKDAAFWVDGRSVGPTRASTIIDGMEIVGNLFENIGVGTGLDTDGAVILQNVTLAPTGGRHTLIANNTFRDTRGQTNGGWNIYVSGDGPGPTILENRFINSNEAAILVSGSVWDIVGDRATGMTDAAIVGNVVQGDAYGGVVLRYENSTATGAGFANLRNTAVENNQLFDSGYGITVEQRCPVDTRIRLNDCVRSSAGIYVGAPCTIYGNEISQSLHVARAGIWLASRGVYTDVSGSVVSFNAVLGSANWGILAATELGNAAATNVDIFNNTVVSNQTGGILLGVAGIDCYNNIIAFHVGSGLRYAATGLGNVGYNLLYNTLTGGVDYMGFPGGTTPFVGDVVGLNPQFVSLIGGNLHLNPNSPAIGAAALLVGGSLIAGGGDQGAYPTGHVSAYVPARTWELYR